MPVESTRHLFVVSGIGPALTTDVFNGIRTRLGTGMCGRKITYVDSIFKGWPHPLLWANEMRDLDPCARLFKSWVPLADVLCKVVQPALEQGHIVIVRRLGYDALMYAIGRMPSDATDAMEAQTITQRNSHAERLHHKGIVPIAIKESGTVLPQYLIPCAEPEDVTDEWLGRSTALRDVDPVRLCQFLEYEKAAMTRYFNPSNGQRSPIALRAKLTIDAMCDTAIEAMTVMVEDQETRSPRAAIA